MVEVYDNMNDDYENINISGIDPNIITDIIHNYSEYHKQPEWLFYNNETDSRSFGRWSKDGGVAYIRGDIVLKLLGNFKNENT